MELYRNESTIDSSDEPRYSIEISHLIFDAIEILIFQPVVFYLRIRVSLALREHTFREVGRQYIQFVAKGLCR